MNSTNSKRKRNRKTRSERNQLSRHLAQDQQEKDNVDKLTKSSNKKSGNTRTLRSKKGVCDIPKLKDFKQQTAKTITKNRLTVQRRVISLANSKSSDWIKRKAGPLPESEAMKKKVDLEMKQMLEMAEQANQREVVDQTDPEPEVYIVASPAQEIAAQVQEVQCSTSPPPICKSLNGMDTSAAATLTTNDCQNQLSTPLSADRATARDSGFSATPPRSTTLEGDVDDTELMQSVADSMIKEPQLCCFKIFEKKEYGNDLKSEILEIWEERKHKYTFAGHDMPIDIYSSSRQYQSYEEYGDTRSALSSCRASPVRSRNHSEVILQADQEEKADSIFGTPIDSSIDSSIFLPATSECDMTSAQCLEPVIRICLNPEEMDTDQEDEEEEDSVLSLARCEYFIASARRLEAEQEALRQMKKQQVYRNNKRPKDEWNDLMSYEKSSSDMFNGINNEDLSVLDSQKFDWDSLLHPGLPSCLSYGKKHPASKPSGRKKSTFNEIKGGLHECHRVCDRQERHQKLPFDQNEQCCCTGCTDSLSTDRDFESDAVNDIYGLSMSRHKLHTALQKACQKPSSKYHSDNSGPNIFSILNPDVSHHDMDDIFGEDTSHDPWGLSDLRSHQVDLQQQAHDFLSSHGASSGKSCGRFASRSHLCPTGSPDSNGSPVWLASSVLKDMVL